MNEDKIIEDAPDTIKRGWVPPRVDVLPRLNELTLQSPIPGGGGLGGGGSTVVP